MVGYDGGGFYSSGGGALPWGSSGGSALSGLNSKDPVGALASNYNKSYNDSLAQNRSLYNNIFEGYKGALNAQQAAQANVGAGYNQLYSEVLGGIQGIGQSQNQAIEDRYRSQSGQQNQQLIDRGLGNTTVQSAVTRGNELDRSKAMNDNNERIAGLRAQYQSSLGTQGLQAQQQAYQANTALLGNQLNWMNSVSAQYPDAGLYGSLAQQYGRGGGGGGGPPVFGGGGGAGTPGLGYAPRPGPSYGNSGTAPTYGGGGGGFGGWATGYGGGGQGSTWSSPYDSGGGDGFFTGIANNIASYGDSGGGYFSGIANNVAGYGDYGGGGYEAQYGAGYGDF